LSENLVFHFLEKLVGCLQQINASEGIVKTSYVLIDYENLQPKNLEKLAEFGFIVIVFGVVRGGGDYAKAAGG